MKKWLLGIVVLFFFGFSSHSIVLADEGHDHEEGQYLKDFSNTESNNEEHEVEAESHESHDSGSSTTEESDSHESHHETDTHDETDAHDSHDSAEDSHGETSTEDAEHSGTNSSHTDSHGVEAEVESSPNYQVLAGFGIVNSAFLLIGVWNKLTRRREKKNGLIQ